MDFGQGIQKENYFFECLPSVNPKEWAWVYTG